MLIDQDNVFHGSKEIETVTQIGAEQQRILLLVGDANPFFEKLLRWCVLYFLQKGIVVHIGDVYSEARTFWELFDAFVSLFEVDLDVFFKG